MFHPHLLYSNLIDNYTSTFDKNFGEGY